jgi:hypothetical protein
MSLPKREKTRRLEGPWPFLYSIDPKRGLVRNLPPEPNPKENDHDRIQRRPRKPHL